jgi:hypothetical protein
MKLLYFLLLLISNSIAGQDILIEVSQEKDVYLEGKPVLLFVAYINNSDQEVYLPGQFEPGEHITKINKDGTIFFRKSALFNFTYN